MFVMNFVWVFLGGGMGSLLRYGISLTIQKFNTSSLPLATFVSNILACIILGCVVYGFKDKMDTSTWISPFIIAGFCGGFSTFSTWSKETLDLLTQGQWIWAISNIIISILVGIGSLYWLKMATSN
jgi:CrcB protein